MSVRRLDDWISAYEEYTDNTESASVFHTWAAIAAISAALKRKVHFEFGRIRLFPNLYIIFIAEPGIARKTQAISFVEKIVSADGLGITLSADATTPQALMEDLEMCKEESSLNDGTTMTHCSLAIFSGEFESFLGNKKDNDKMLITLTDFYDGKNRPFRYRTKHSGSNTIPDIYLSILAATTPESLANCLPSKAIGGGLTSRIVFVWADRKERKVPIPYITDAQRELEKKLVIDLSIISRIIGTYRYSESGFKWWQDFYQAYEEKAPTRICKDNAFTGWYSRKPTILLKLGVVCAASESDERLVHARHFDRALKLLEATELGMGRTFSAVGRSEITAEVDLVRSIIAHEGSIAEKVLLQRVWRDIDARKLDNVMQTIIRSGDVTRTYQGPTGQQAVWYHWKGKENCGC